MGKNKTVINIGDKFNRLTIIREVDKNKHGRRFLAICSCKDKTVKEYYLSHLISGKIQSCGCLHKEIVSSRRRREIGNIYGRLTVTEEVGRNKFGHRVVKAQCSCDGNIKIYEIDALRRGGTKSCGCYAIEKLRENKIESRENAIGRKYNKITVIKDTGHNKRGDRLVLGKCECDGNIKEYILYSLQSGRTKSCGCLGGRGKKYAKRQYEQFHPILTLIEEIRDSADGDGIEVKCKNMDCQIWFRPTNHQIKHRLAALENPIRHEECNFYCSPECSGSCILYRLKSNSVIYNNLYEKEQYFTEYELQIFSDEVKKRQFDEYGHNFCELKGHISDKPYHAHHVISKKQEWIYGLDPDNGIVVCEDCHNELHKGECSTGALKKIKCNNGK